MDDKKITVSAEGFSGFRLRAICSGDLEHLRVWKNQNKGSFFLKDEITPAQQSDWFSQFTRRNDDHIYVVEQNTSEGWESIGCMGFRVLVEENCVDAYNIMRAKKIEPADFSMSDAFLTMLAFARSLYPAFPVRCKVLSDNPALTWYAKNGFREVEDCGSYRLLELDPLWLEGRKFEVGENI